MDSLMFKQLFDLSLIDGHAYKRLGELYLGALGWIPRFCRSYRNIKNGWMPMGLARLRRVVVVPISDR
jgi:hypothetical protein